MAETRFTKDHEYIRVEDGVGTIGITHFAQEKLGDVTFVELPAIGAAYVMGDGAGVVESVKAASEVYSPVSGEVIEVNAALTETPELVNQEPETAAWFFKLRLANPAELAALMDKAAYDAFVAEQH